MPNASPTIHYDIHVKSIHQRLFAIYFPFLHITQALSMFVSRLDTWQLHDTRLCQAHRWLVC